MDAEMSKRVLDEFLKKTEDLNEPTIIRPWEQKMDSLL